jgi:hypothetical protein
MTTEDWPGDTAPLPHQPPVDRVGDRLRKLAADIAYTEGRPVDDVIAALETALKADTQPRRRRRPVPLPMAWGAVGWFDCGAA